MVASFLSIVCTLTDSPISTLDAPREAQTPHEIDPRRTRHRACQRRDHRRIATLKARRGLGVQDVRLAHDDAPPDHVEGRRHGLRRPGLAHLHGVDGRGLAVAARALCAGARIREQGRRKARLLRHLFLGGFRLRRRRRREVRARDRGRTAGVLCGLRNEA